MARLAQALALCGLMALAAGEAKAQYYPPYDEPPPPGYGPPGRGYYEPAPPPPPGYGPPGRGYYEPPPPPPAFGYRCNARAFTPNGPRRVVCALGRPRPVGRFCTCPPPPPPPGYSPGPPLEGRVVP